MWSRPYTRGIRNLRMRMKGYWGWWRKEKAKTVSKLLIPSPAQSTHSLPNLQLEGKRIAWPLLKLKNSTSKTSNLCRKTSTGTWNSLNSTIRTTSTKFLKNLKLWKENFPNSSSWKAKSTASSSPNPEDKTLVNKITNKKKGISKSSLSFFKNTASMRRSWVSREGLMKYSAFNFQELTKA